MEDRGPYSKGQRGIMRDRPCGGPVEDGNGTTLTASHDGYYISRHPLYVLVMTGDGNRLPLIQASPTASENEGDGPLQDISGPPEVVK